MKTRTQYLLDLQFLSSDNPSPKELKSQWRKLSFEKHPDKNPDNKNASEEIKIINEAYEALSEHKYRTTIELKEITPDDIAKRASEKLLSFLDSVCDTIIIPKDRIILKLINNTLVYIKVETETDRYLLINNYPIKLKIKND